MKRQFMITKRVVYLLSAVCLAITFSLAGCQNTKKSSSDKQTDDRKVQTAEKNIAKENSREESPQDDQEEISPFFPEIPSQLTTKEEQAKYVFLHYWDRFPFNDKSIFRGKENPAEQHLANYLSFFAYGAPSEEMVNESLKNFTDKMGSQTATYENIMKLLNKYLYNPNSPYYNEDLLIKIMKNLIANPNMDEARKSSLRFKKQLMELNRPGSKASDFAYTTISGKSSTLMNTKVGNVPLLLVFFDPNCPECHKTIELMKEDSQLDNYIREGKLMVLAIYTENEQSAWDKVPGMFPPLWMVGNDHGEIKEKLLYDLKALPTVYLLNPNKEVILKDVPYQTAMSYLQRYN